MIREATLEETDAGLVPASAGWFVTKHAFVGAGETPFVLLCASSRQFQKDGPWGFYCADETAARHNASSPEDTQENEVADAGFSEPPRPSRYPGGLPD